MLVRLTLSVVLLFALVTPAAAEPISLAITSAAIAFSSAGGGLSLATAIWLGEQAASLAFTVAFTLGGNVLTRLLAPGGGGSAGSVVNSPAVRGLVKQASVPQRIVFGRARISGIVYLYKVRPPRLYLGIIYSSLPLREIGPLTVEEQTISFNRSGSIWTPNAPPFLVGGVNRIRVAFQEGTIDQPVNPLIAAVFPELGADFRLPGLANAVWEFHYGADFDEFQSLWGQVQIPNPLVETTSGAPVYDPRRPLQRWPDDWRDPEDVDDAIATWEPTRNASLIQALWRAAPFGLNAGFDGTDWDQVARAADFDDRPIGLKAGGFIPRGTIDGVVTLDERPNSIMDSMLTANRGFQVRRAGKGWIAPMRPEDPKFTITDAMVRGSVQFRRDRPKRDRRNVGRTLFIAPERQFTEVNAPFLIRQDLIDDDGEELELTLRLPFTIDHQNAQRLTKELIDESLLERSLSMVCAMTAFGLREADVVRVDSRKYPHWNGIYQVDEWALSDDRVQVSFTLVEFDKAISVAWNPTIDERDFPALGEAA